MFYTLIGVMKQLQLILIQSINLQNIIEIQLLWQNQN